MTLGVATRCSQQGCDSFGKRHALLMTGQASLRQRKHKVNVDATIAELARANASQHTSTSAACLRIIAARAKPRQTDETDEQHCA